MARKKANPDEQQDGKRHNIVISSTDSEQHAEVLKKLRKVCAHLAIQNEEVEAVTNVTALNFALDAALETFS